MDMYRLLLWVPLVLYAASSWPQILTNYRRKEASGLSQWMLFLRVTTVLFYLSYIFLCDLPFAHKVLYPWCVGGLLVLAVQTYCYRQSSAQTLLLRVLYGVVVAVLGMIVLYGQQNPIGAGMLAGWVSFFGGIGSDIPQIYRNWWRKSTVGFSPLFALLIGLGGLCDLIVSIYFCLPLPTLLTTARVVVCCSVYFVQFWLYRH